MEKETNLLPGLHGGVDSSKQFKGYTLEEIRYQRALTALKKEFCASKITQNCNRIKKRKFFTSGGASGFASNNTWTGRILSGLSMVDYMLIGFSAFSTVKKVLSMFSKKKK